MAKEPFDLSNFANEKDRDDILTLLANFPDPQGAQGGVGIDAFDPVIDPLAPVAIKVEDVTSSSHPENSSDYGFRLCRLQAETADFHLYIGKNYVEFSWVGGGGISFNPLALHKIVFGELAAATGTKHLVPPGEDGVKKAQFLYKPTNETTFKTLSLATEQGRLSYFDLMRNPSALQWIRYDVVDSQFGLLYTFGIDAKNHSLNTGTVRLGVPRAKEWTDDMIYWAVVNHKQDPLISNSGVAPSLTAKINQLRKDTPSFQ